MMTKMKLFKKDQKNLCRYWSIHLENDEIVTRWGVVDGKEQESRRKVVVNNSGRSFKEQADLEMKSEYQLKIDKDGYAESLEKLDSNQSFRPMLAEKYQNVKNRIKFPVLIQPKFDGMRLLVYMDDDKVIKKTRSGKFMHHITHLDKQLREYLNILPRGSVLDGELYIHGIPFQNFISVAKGTVNNHKDQSLLEYHIYDIITDGSYIERYNILKKTFDDMKLRQLFLADTFITESEDEINESHAQFILDGYEGSIIRTLTGKYKQGGRSSDVLKKKDFFDEEATVIDVNSVESGNEKGCALYSVRGDDGVEYNVRPKGSFEERRKIYKNRKDVIGKRVTVKYQKKSNTGVPLFPVAICIRDYE